MSQEPPQERRHSPRRPGQRSPRRYRPTPLLLASILFHLLVVAAVVVMPDRFWQGLLAIFLNHVVISLVGLVPKGRALGPNLIRLSPSMLLVPSAADDQSEGVRRARIALSFDDGPDPEVTPRVLDLLDEFGAKASFFCIGERLTAHRDLGAEIVRRGHRLENHSFAHSTAFSVFFPPAIARDLGAAQEVIEEISGRPGVWFRAPAGLRNLWLEPVLARLGLNLVTWTRRGFDTVNGDPHRIVGSLTRKLASGDILLLHDGSSARTASGAPVVLETLPMLLKVIEAMDFEIVAIPDPSEESTDPIE